MSDKEKGVIEHANLIIKEGLDREDDIQTILKKLLNLIQKQQAEIEKKDKIIDLIADKLVEAHEWFYSEFDNYTKEDFKQYFEKQVEKE